jgi:hypothetical protein
VTGTAMAALAAASAELFLLAVVLGLACAVAVVPARRATRAEGPLEHLGGWLGDREVRRASTGATMQMLTNGLVQVGLPAWLIVEGHVSAGGAAALLLGMTLPMASMGPITGRRAWVAFDGRLRRGLAGCAFGLVGLAVATSAGPWWIVGPALVVVGLGAGSLLAPSLTAFAHSPAGGDTVALSLYNLLRLGAFGIGGLIAGVAVDAEASTLAFIATAALCIGSGIAVRGTVAPARTIDETGGNHG